MKKKIFERVNESLLMEKLDNGLEVYLYKTNKTKNFYITISVKYGANVTKYKIGDKVTEIIPGSAHFLEHKVMALSENKETASCCNLCSESYIDQLGKSRTAPIDILEFASLIVPNNVSKDPLFA